MTPTVLIVDDDPTLVEMLTFVLGHGGLQTRAAYDGQRALEILAAEPIDAVILDIMLPDMDGFEICQQIRALPEVGQVPILMLSARTQVADRLTGFDVGADDYVPKPADPKEIVARVRALLTRAERSRAAAAPTITLVGAKGGVGTTTTALNVALALCSARERVVLLELGAMGLSAPWVLGIQPERSLTDLAPPKGFHLTLAALESIIITHESGLAYLAGRPHDVTPARFHAGLIAETLRLLQGRFDAVIIDLAPAALTACTEALIHSTAVVPVAEHDSLSLWHLRALLDWLNVNKLSGKVPGFVLVDRTPSPHKPTPADVAGQVGLGILGVVPDAGLALCHANGRQEPLFLADPEEPTSLACKELGRRLTATPIVVPPELSA